MSGTLPIGEVLKRRWAHSEVQSTTTIYSVFAKDTSQVRLKLLVLYDTVRAMLENFQVYTDREVGGGEGLTNAVVIPLVTWRGELWPRGLYG